MAHLWKRFRAHVRRGAAAYLVLAVALVPTGIAYDRVHRSARAQEQARFQERSQEIIDAMQDSLNRYAAVFGAVDGFFEASDEVSPLEWTRFIGSLDLEHRYPGMRSIGYAPLLKRTEIDAFSKHVSKMVGTNFTVGASGEPLVAPTLYLEQFGGARNGKVGWDAMGDPARRAAIETLLKERRPVLTQPSLFSGDVEPLPGVIVNVPVFAVNANQNKGAIIGVVFSSFVPQKLIRSFNKNQLDPELFVRLDRTGNEYSMTLATLGGVTAPEHPDFERSTLLRLFTEQFAVKIMTTPAFQARSRTHIPTVVLCSGIIFSLMLFGIAWTQVNGRAAAEALNKRLLLSEDQLLRSNRELERHVEEHKATESLLAHERDLLRTLLDHSPDRIYFKDLESRFIKCGKAVVARLGLSDASEAIGKTDFDFFKEEHARVARDMELHIIRTGEPSVGVVEKETWQDGHETWVLTSKMPLRDKHGNIIGTFGTSKDITSLKQAKNELEKEKELLAVTLGAIGDGVITTDTEGRIVLFNKVAEQLTGCTQQEAQGRSLREVFHTAAAELRESDTEIVRRAMSSGEVVAQERGSVLVARDGTEKNISESVAPIVDREGKTIGAVLVFRDITEKLKTEAELLRSSKLESIGVLAGGIAHDFNNILTVILGNISLARMLNDNLPQPVANVLGEAEKASFRARDLTQRLLTFAKGGAPIKKIVSLAPLLRDCTKAALQGSKVNYQFFLADDLWTVNADEAQLAQVFQNLMQHARNAVSETPVIDVHASNIEMSRDPLMFLMPGRYVRISIRDHGPGLQPDQLNKIFDPYFSAKKHGGGLELATAYSIVRKHEGQIRVESISGQGTVFHVYLPAATATEKVEVRPARKLPSIVGGRVLVMDDEPAIRQLASTLLHRIGYTAVAVADGAEAVTKYEAARRAGQPFDAVVMDLTVPNGMGGVEAVRELRAIDPGVKAIVSSGYSNDPVMANFRDFGFIGVVPKPYNADDLAGALGELLTCTQLQEKTDHVEAVKSLS